MKKKRLKPEVKIVAFFLVLALLFVAANVITTEPKTAQNEPSASVTTLEKTTEASTEIKQAYLEVTEANTTEESKETLPFGEFYITGYTPTCEHCCDKTDGIASSGAVATVGRTAAMHPIDMDIFGIEYGDSIYIEGIGERVVEDTGCGRGVIDVACESHEDCYKVTGYSVVEVKK